MESADQADTDSVPINSGSTSTSPEPPNTSTLSCEMCQNYEINLTALQENDRKVRKELHEARQTAERYQTELRQERQYRADMEKRMAEMASQTDDKIHEAVAQSQNIEAAMSTLEKNYKKSIDEMSLRLEGMRTETKKMEDEYTKLSQKYTASRTTIQVHFFVQDLLGIKSRTATEMRAETIDFPTDPEQLMFLCLKSREELIEVKSAKEHRDAYLTDQITVLQEQLKEEQRLRINIEASLMEQYNHAQTELGIANSKLAASSRLQTSSEEQTRQIKELQHTISELENQVAQVQNERAAVETTAQNYKARCSALQAELETSEHVQMDFVKLSQSLQIQLEKIRQAAQEVRWQWEDEHEKCSNCETSIAKLKPKPRCLHCVKLFCPNCVKQTVPSGSNHRPAPVCQVCHTLLNRDSKPFFAQDSL